MTILACVAPVGDCLKIVLLPTIIPPVLQNSTADRKMVPDAEISPVLSQSSRFQVGIVVSGA